MFKQLASKILLRTRPHWRALLLRLSPIAVFLATVEIAIRFTSPGMEHWHYALHRLYYLAVIAGGLSFGWPGGLITALISSALYLLHTSDTDSPDARNALDRHLETFVFCLVGLLAGVLAERERSQRRKAERVTEELQQANQELHLNRQHLERAGRMAALGHMSAGLAHEIRNPLASIAGAACIVEEADANQSRRREFLGIIQKECSRLDRLVSNFLEFARPRTPALRAVELGALIRSVVDFVKQTGARRNIEFTLAIPVNLPALNCDAEQIRQVLLNLILNAAQAMPDGGKISVTAHIDGKRVVTRVCDNGPGVPVADVESIYDPFFTTKETGTGLGLPTAFRIIEQHGGELLLESNSSTGACFAFLLPLRTSN